MNDVSLDTAVIVSLVCGCILYGIFLVFFAISIHVLVNRRKTPRPNLFLLAVSIILFANATAFQALSIVRVVEAFIVNRDTMGVLVYLNTAGTQRRVVQAAIEGADFLCADFILIYRCLILWRGKRTIVMIPILIFIASLATGCMTLSFIVRDPNEDTPPHQNDPGLECWVAAFMALTLVQNVVATGLLLWRVYSVESVANQYRYNVSSPVISMLFGTTGIYVLTQIALLITYVLRTNAFYIVYDIANQMIGIAFTAIIVKVGLGSGSSGPTSALPSARPQQPRFAPPPGTVLFQREVEVVDPGVDGDVPAELHLCKTISHVQTIRSAIGGAARSQC